MRQQQACLRQKVLVQMDIVPRHHIDETVTPVSYLFLALAWNDVKLFLDLIITPTASATDVEQAYARRLNYFFLMAINYVALRIHSVPDINISRTCFL